jgi:acetyl esterase
VAPNVSHADPLAALAVDPPDDTARINALIEAAIAAAPPAYTQDAVAFREQSDNYNRSTRKECAEAVERTIAGGIAARVFLPPRVTSVYLYIHGGAWMMGARDLADEMLWARATRADTAVVSIDYRLAPEHRWPACAEDCEAAARWLVENAVAEFGTDRLLIGGDSAGAHLSVVTLLALRDGNQTGFCGADLRYGMFDLRLTGGARIYEGVALEAKTLAWVLDLCFDDDVRDSAPASPMLADLRDMPPALFTVGTKDSLLEDTLLMWARWRAAGNAAQLVIHPGAMHAFDYGPTAAAAQALEDSIAFIRARAG